MSALEEIQRAIEKLTKLRGEMSDGPWYASWHGTRYVVGSDEIGEVASGEYVRDIGQSLESLHEDADTSDFDLIVTLHRTIDAQLGILRHDYGVCVGNDWIPDRHILALARAINGTT